jgi:N-acylneuraminate cytidylyltransferase
MNSVVAIIPARGGSKRIQRKNIRDFHGLPILAYSIKAADASGCFDKIVVSTDDDEIAAVAREFGAETPFKRPADLADDHTGTTAVIRHALQWLDEHGHNFEFTCCIYPTAPFLEAGSLREGLSKLRDSECSFAF